MSTTWITPGRHTRLILDTPVPALDRPAFTVERYGGQISRARTERNDTARVSLQPGNAWTLAPVNGNSSGLLTSEWSGDAIGGAMLPGPGADVDLAPGWGTIDSYQSPASLPGMGASPDLITAGAPAFLKRVTAGASWASTLLASIAALPQPTLFSQLVPMDRVLAGKVTYPANCGFLLKFTVREDLNLPDTLCSFYFGGNNVTYPTGRTGGQFCLTVLGNGSAQLREYTGASPDPWTLRHEFPWRLQRASGSISHHFITIWPYGQDTIAFRLLDMDAVLGSGGFTLGNITTTLAGHLSGSKVRDATFYRNVPGITGYAGVNAITGPGTIHLDVRRDLRAMFQITRLRPPEDGTLTDLPFRVPFPIPAGTPLVVSARTFRPSGTGITAQLYNAENDVALTQTSTNVFASVAGVQNYYAKLTFTADDDREQTPVLYSYKVAAAGSIQDRAPATSYGGNIRSVNITGPDLSPDQETAQVAIEDPTNALETPLRTRGRIPAQLRLYDDNGNLTSILFQGEVGKAQAQKKGKTGQTYPSPQWRHYNVTMVGVWARLAEWVNLDLLRYHTDDDAPVGQNGTKPPWKITAIIADMLGRAGFPADTLAGLPDLNIRWWAADGASSGDQLIQPTVSFAETILRFARDFLGMTLLWDPNAGTRGVWRLLERPVAPYSNVLCAFLGGPATAGKLAMHPNSYAAGTAPVIGESFHTFIRPPEANYVHVVGMEPVIPSQVQAILYNPVSFDLTGPTANNNHPDYLGRCVPVLHVDPLITTKEAAAWVCRRIYDRVAHAEKWLRWQSPLVLVTDPLDTLQVRVRPLRIYDVVTVYGATAIIRSVNPEYQSDGIQLANYEAVAV